MVSRDVWRPRIPLSDSAIKAFCDKWQISEVWVFGSVLRDDFGPDSDFDVAIAYCDGVSWPWTGIPQITDELAQLMGRPVDVGMRAAIDEDRNPYRRNHILKRITSLYAS